MLQRGDRLLLRSRRAGHVKDFFLEDRSVQVVHAITKRKLRQREAHADPVGRDVVDIIEINPTDCEVAQLFNRRCLFDVRKHGCLRLKRKRHKTGESVSLVLQFTKLAQMIDPLLQSLDMTVQHRTGAATTHLMPNPMGIEPFLSGFFTPADLIANYRIEDLSASARYRAQARIAKDLKHVLYRQVKDTVRQMSNFNRGKSFYMQVGIESP